MADSQSTSAKMHGDLATKIAEIQNLIADLTPVEKSAKDTCDANPGDEHKKRVYKSLAQQLKILNEQVDFLNDLQEETRSLHKKLGAPLTTPSSVTQIKLKAPQPFKIGDDFEIFFELFRSFTANETYERSIQILKTLLHADAYKICKHVFDEVDTMYELEGGLHSVFAKATNQTSAIHKFRSIKQLKDESLESFVTRIRICAAEAFPTLPQAGREPFMVQMFIQGLNVSQTQKNLLSVTEHASLSEILVVAARMGDETTEIHSIESTQGRAKFCNYCKRSGHDINECRTRQRRTGGTVPPHGSVPPSNSAPNQPHRESASACYNCRQPGHIARHCQAPPLFCQLCDKRGHIARECRTVKFTMVKTNPEQSYGNSVPNNAASNLPPTNPFQGNGPRLA